MYYKVFLQEVNNKTTLFFKETRFIMFYFINL